MASPLVASRFRRFLCPAKKLELSLLEVRWQVVKSHLVTGEFIDDVVGGSQHYDVTEVVAQPEDPVRSEIPPKALVTRALRFLR
jgi:hypothetical protein